jgi:hypothetical protein
VVVWSLPPKGDSEGPPLISRTAPTPTGLAYLRIKDLRSSFMAHAPAFCESVLFAT